MTENHTRRTVLKTGAALGGAAMVGSLSGCSSLLGGDGIEYTNWLYEPGAIGDQDHYSFSVTTHQSVRDNEDALDDTETYDEREAIEDEFPLNQMDVDYEDVNMTISPGSGHVVLGSFSESDAIEELEDNDFDEEDDHEGYTIFVKGGGDSTERRRVIALNGSTAVAAEATFGGEEGETQDIVETLIDTKAGEEDRYVDESEDMALLVDELDDGVVVAGGTGDETEETDVESGQFEGAVASGISVTIDGETTEINALQVFADSDDVDTDDVEEWAENNELSFQGVENIEVSEDGRTAVITGDADTEEYFGIGDTDDPAPSASLNYEADESNNQIVISHDSGDSFALGDAQVNLDDGSTTTVDGTTLNDVVSEGSDFQFIPGDSIEIDDSGATTPAVGSGSGNTIEIELVWAPGGGDAQSVFSEDTLRNVDLALQSGNSNVN